MTRTRRRPRPRAPEPDDRARARSPFVESARFRRRAPRVRDRVVVFAFGLGVVAAIVGIAFAAGYIVGKLIL